MTHDTPPSSLSKYKNIISHLTKFLQNNPQDQNDLINVLKYARRKHLLDAEALSMIERVFQFSKMRVKDIMVPRIQMNVVKKEVTLEKIFSIVVELGHSRFPVIEEDRSKVVGILLAKDLLAYSLGNKKQKVADIMRPVSLIPESKRLNVLLKEFRTEFKHMAIIVDEYGMVSGLVTIEDVLEEIVGEIRDEHTDKEESYVQKCSDKKYNIKALMPIIEFNQFFSSNVADAEHDTIGGFIIHQLGHVPKKGEKVMYDKFNFEVLHADNRRINLLKLKLN